MESYKYGSLLISVGIILIITHIIGVQCQIVAINRNRSKALVLHDRVIGGRGLIDKLIVRRNIVIQGRIVLNLFIPFGTATNPIDEIQRHVGFSEYLSPLVVEIGCVGVVPILDKAAEKL